jgi:hypothetical protein
MRTRGGGGDGNKRGFNKKFETFHFDGEKLRRKMTVPPLLFLECIKQSLETDLLSTCVPPTSFSIQCHATCKKYTDSVWQIDNNFFTSFETDEPKGVPQLFSLFVCKIVSPPTHPLLLLLLTIFIKLY